MTESPPVPAPPNSEPGRKSFPSPAQIEKLAASFHPDLPDTRNYVQRTLMRLEFSSPRALMLSALCFAIAFSVGYLPLLVGSPYSGLSVAGHRTLFILILAAGLWVSEAIPAFAVALLVIGLELALLGRPDGVWATDSGQWQIFVQPWASPVLWLFFGGFILAEASTKTRLDRWIAATTLGRFGTRPATLLGGAMLLTFVFSMFMSNTATTVMMMAVMAPVLGQLDIADPFRKALLLGVPFAANVGGMGTIIGSPPNAIAADAMRQSGETIGFGEWMLVGLPVALVLALVLWGFLVLRFPSQARELPITSLKNDDPSDPNPAPLWRRILVMLTFALTVTLWMTERLHGTPVAVVAFIPVVVFAATGTITSDDVRKLSWDVLLLIAGGLSLGVAIKETGLAEWLVGSIPISEMGLWGASLSLSYLLLLISNFMSNTAASAIIIPIGASIGAEMGGTAALVIPLALASSAAMCLPISTPPNAIAFSVGQLSSRDFIVGGLIAGTLGPLLAVVWSNVASMILG